MFCFSIVMLAKAYIIAALFSLAACQLEEPLIDSSSNIEDGSSGDNGLPRAGILGLGRRGGGGLRGGENGVLGVGNLGAVAGLLGLALSAGALGGGDNGALGVGNFGAPALLGLAALSGAGGLGGGDNDVPGVGNLVAPALLGLAALRGVGGLGQN